ncbi:MAG: hypothetical protein JWN59_1311 [Sphingomonas bacterium]|nr:hypothetical protein [Sphingomonas bacterium]MDB5684710.1 hypothetical protein [Sphingomonas bacterium]
MCRSEANPIRPANGHHVAVTCFGETGMHQPAKCATHVPLAAGLFGVPSATEHVLSGAADRERQSLGAKR